MIRASRAIAARFRRAMRRAVRAEDGNSTIEFMIMVPMVLTIFISSFESGLLMTRQVMLERGVDIVIRNIRLGIPTTAAAMRDDICEIATIIPDCSTSLLLELRPVSQISWSPLNDDAVCIERDEKVEPYVQWKNGGANELMMVRACAVFDPLFPYSAFSLPLSVDTSGAYALTATSAFMNEPD